MLSTRLKYFDSSDFRQAVDRQKSLNDPIDLSVGIPGELTPEHVKSAGKKAIDSDKTAYTPANGILELREAISKKFKEENGINCTADNVTVVPGLTTGQLLVYLAILDPGDEIIVMDPYYPPYTHLASMVGAHVVHVPCLSNFQPNLSLIESSISKRTKAIIINSPNNPTGAVYTKKTIEKIAEIAGKHDILVISDEIYEHFVFDNGHISIGSIYPNTLTLNGFSKAFAMTGWRVGYMCGPAELIDAINELQQYTVMSSSSIAQHAAIEALKHPPESIYKKYLAKRDFMVSELTKLGYKIEGGEGAFYLFIRTPQGMDDVEFTNIAADNNMIVIPGRSFSANLRGFVRISYGADMKTLKKAIEVFKKVDALHSK